MSPSLLLGWGMPIRKGRQAGWGRPKLWGRVAQDGAAENVCSAGRLRGWAAEGNIHT